MMTLIRTELFKIFSKWRTYIGFIAMAVLIPLIHGAMLAEGEAFVGMATKTLSESFNFSGNLLNGYMVTRIIMQGLIVQIPFLIALVGGDLLAGEATAGTYRLLLTRPVSRHSVVFAKFVAGSIYVLLMMLWMTVLSLGLGVAIFGTGDLIVVSSKITVLPEGIVMSRFISAFLFSYLAMWCVYTISFFFSALVENAIGPIMTTMAIIIVFSLINLFGGGILDYVKPLLFTEYMQAWRGYFDQPIDYHRINVAILALLLHVIGLYSITHYIFIKKDIHS